MDPLTQGLLGAGLATSFARKTKVRVAAVLGALGGMAPDLDVFIRSEQDSLLYIEYHRHFTHSLAFIPIGGLLVAALLWLVLFRKTQSFNFVYIFTTLGFATHALLDACTSYGTRLWLPFSDERVAWNIMSIVDPIFTATLLLFFIAAIWRKSARTMIVGMCLAMLYVGHGVHKHNQVAEIVHLLAESRGHKVERLLLNPTVGNNILWRSVYESGDEYYVDAVRVGLLSDSQILEGEAVPVVDVDALYPDLPKDSVQYKDIGRFDYFSQGYIYEHPKYENVLADLRYGALPNDTNSMWGIEVNTATPNEHVEWKSLRKFSKAQYDEFWKMLLDGFDERK